MYFRETINDKKLSFLGLGCWRFGEQETPQNAAHPGKNYWNGQKRTDSLKIIDFAIANGITHFDTAQAYGLGVSEQTVGQRLKKSRDKVIIATKIMPTSNNTDGILKRISLSLKRLCTDYIDILYLHWPGKNYDIRFAVEALEKARSLGTIRNIGVSNFSAPEIKAALGSGNIDFCQTGYNLLWQHREKDVIPFCVTHKISIIAYSFYAQGLLFKKNIETDHAVLNSRRKDLVFLRKENIEIVKKVAAGLADISLSSGYTITQLLINWAKAKPWLAGILAGASVKSQIVESAKALDVPVDSTICQNIEELAALCKDIEDTQNIFAHNFTHK
ncbi:MAG: aldo/keto reductase [Spirochaetes bacterium]|nr:aldo/keto reductase [Spirochaetota bacterium]